MWQTRTIRHILHNGRSINTTRDFICLLSRMSRWTQFPIWHDIHVHHRGVIVFEDIPVSPPRYNRECLQNVFLHCTGVNIWSHGILSSGSIKTILPVLVYINIHIFGTLFGRDWAHLLPTKLPSNYGENLDFVNNEQPHTK